MKSLTPNIVLKTKKHPLSAREVAGDLISEAMIDTYLLVSTSIVYLQQD